MSLTLRVLLPQLVLGCLAWGPQALQHTSCTCEGYLDCLASCLADGELTCHTAWPYTY
jgi:hypothetical protein